MPTITHPHNLNIKKAVAQLQLLARQLEEKYAHKASSYKSEWVSQNTMTFSVTYMGKTVEGKISVDNKNATIEYNLPWIFKAMNKLIARKIVNTFEKIFNDPKVKPKEAYAN